MKVEDVTAQSGEYPAYLSLLKETSFMIRNLESSREFQGTLEALWNPGRMRSQLLCLVVGDLNGQRSQFSFSIQQRAKQ